MNKTKKYDRLFNKFIPYLNDIGISTDILIDRIWYFYSLFKGISKENIIDILVEDRLGKDGMREYPHLSFFTKHYAMSAQDFITDNSLITTSLTNRILYWRAISKDFDLNKSNAKSSLRIVLAFLNYPDVESVFIATGINCEYLMKLVKNYVIPNVNIVSHPKSGPLM